MQLHYLFSREGLFLSIMPVDRPALERIAPLKVRQNYAIEGPPVALITTGNRNSTGAPEYRIVWDNEENMFQLATSDDFLIAPNDADGLSVYKDKH